VVAVVIGAGISKTERVRRMRAAAARAKKDI
jgi:hypothetical protein